MRFKILILISVLFLLIPAGFAADEFKPYLHKSTVPEHPKVRLFGQYQTNLFPGAATYNYQIEVPKGTNGLQPSITISYNSQSVKQRPGILGAGWSLTSNQIYRDINATPENSYDDEFILVLDGASYELIYSPADSRWHTGVESYFKIENLTSGSNNYWQLTKKDGTKYRFGYNSDSELDSNTGKNYALKWSLDLVEDTHGNKIYYSYLEDPFSEDAGAVYLHTIDYNNDQKRKIEFNYDKNTRPDRRLVYEQGNKLEESRRLNDISIYANTTLVRRYNFNYIVMNPALSSISNIKYYGSDNTSLLHNITFDYYTAKEGYYNNDTGKWIPPDLFSGSSYNDRGVRMVDINNDGFMDIVRRQTTENKVWLNNKTTGWDLSSWTLPAAVVNGVGVDWGVRFEDVNLDGLTDLLESRGGVRNVYLNNGTNWNLSSWTIPIDIVAGDGTDIGVRLADVNGDGRIDLVKAYLGTRTVYFNNRSGWNSSSWTVPEDFVTGDFHDRGLRLIDLNGDGLADLIKGYNGERSAWINNGTGWFNYSSWTPPVDFLTASRSDNGIRFADVNNDGLIDLMEDYLNGSTWSRNAWINNGSGWIANNSWQSPEPFIAEGHNVGRRLADVNGDGSADIVVSYWPGTQFTWLKNSTTAYMLKSITNEYGGITTIEYTSSTLFNNSENGTSEIGFNIFVVKNVTTNNGFNSTNSSFAVLSSSNYNYSYGKYDYKKSEFRGFKIVIENRSSSIVYHYFYQDDARKGKEYQTEIYDKNGNIYSKNIKNYNWTQNNGIYNLSLISSIDYIYDGILENPKITNKSYDYDSYGNLLLVYESGDVNITGDERTTNYTYAYHTGNWILDKIASVTVYDKDGNKAKETRYFYDDLGFQGMADKGELTKIEKWNNNENNSFSYFEYDSYGNIISETDSLGYSTKYSYDKTNTYVDSATNALGHINYFDYNLGTGNLNWEEKNGIRKSYEYDTFGRISKEIMPYDTSQSPTKKYAYNFDGVAPESVKISLKTTSNKTDSMSYFYDGFANLVQIKIDVENSRQVVKNIFYDDNYRIGSEQNPYFAGYSGNLSSVSSSSNFTNYTYDALDRVIKVLNPDRTEKNITFYRYNITDYDENRHKHGYELDAYGRIVKVYEYNVNDVGINETYETIYEYNTNDNLIRITDSAGNEFSFTYDSLNRKTAISDPDLGSWAYSYDANGNLVLQRDARNKTIRLGYDALNRITAKNSTDVNITFGYDKDYYGTLSNISMGNITYSYDYDDRLRVIKEKLTVSGVDFETSFIYDSQDRIVSKEGLSEIDYIFNKQGKVKKIPSFINDSNYNSFGNILNRTYANNLVQSFSYNMQNNRLNRILIPTIQNLTYTYDNVGNILTIINTIDNKNHYLTYDNLDRLVQANIGSDRYVYSFNSIGNVMKIVKNSESKKFVYNGNQTHAPSRIIEGDAGIDIYAPSDLNTSSKNRTFKFYLVNDKNTSLTGVNFTIDFGDGNSLSNNSLTIDDNITITVNHNYTHGGDYKVNITAFSTGIIDRQFLNLKFGTRAKSLQKLYSNTSNTIFEFEIHNDITEKVNNVSWNCSNGINSTYFTNLTGNQSLYDYMQHNFTSDGEKTFSCTALSIDGNESKTIAFTIKSLKIEEYENREANATTREIKFNIKNYYHNLDSVTWTIDSDGQQFTNTTSLNAFQTTTVRQNITYTTDGKKTVKINTSSGLMSDTFSDSFTLEGAKIENYQRTDNNLTNKIIVFDIKNNWYGGVIWWNITNPSITNSTTLNTNKTLMVIIAHNYTDQGNNKINITAKISSFIATVKDFFEIRPLQIESFQTLSESKASTISEIAVKNNLNTMQYFSWTFNSGQANITSSNLLNISSTNLFVYIASNYSNEGVYRTQATINSSSYNDTEKGVVIT